MVDFSFKIGIITMLEIAIETTNAKLMREEHLKIGVFFFCICYNNHARHGEMTKLMASFTSLEETPKKGVFFFRLWYTYCRYEMILPQEITK